VTYRIAINGFGRTGRLTLRAALERRSNLEFVAINRGDSKTMAHLLKYDTVHGKAPFDVTVEDEYVVAGNQKILTLYESDPEKLPWEELEVDLVLESSGKFRNRSDASKHLKAGANKVLISAPAKNPDITIVLGVNDNEYKHKEHHIISNASCTTNCIAPIAKVLNNEFGIEKGFMSTTHAYTTNQNILDKSHKDLRRARAAAANIIPTTTGAAAATGIVIPELNGKMNGVSFRVPITNVSIIDFVTDLRRTVTVDEANDSLKKASETYMHGILEYNEDPLVSSDYIHNPHSGIIDGLSTMVIENLVKIIAWYDNEWGYCCRLVDVSEKIASY
jgi:glyceraldehyde 3-phosphate dehydrogenase